LPFFKIIYRTEITGYAISGNSKLRKSLLQQVKTSRKILVLAKNKKMPSYIAIAMVAIVGRGHSNRPSCPVVISSLFSKDRPHNFMKHFLALSGIAIMLALSLGACSHVVSVTKTQSTLSYSNRIPARVGLYLSPDIAGYALDITESGSGCEGNSYPCAIGPGLSDALQTGAAVACQDIIVFSAPPTPESIKAQNVKFVIIPRVSNVNGDLSFTKSFFTYGIKGTFQASLTMSLMDATGGNFYSFTSNGTGFSTTSGSCGDGADCMTKAISSALQQIADNVAQTLNSAVQVRDAVK
jgi:hypothetical protein